MKRSRLKKHSCPDCDAPLPHLEPGQTFYRCTYCHREIEVEKLGHRSSPRPAAAPAPAAAPRARVGLLVTLAAGGVVAWLVLHHDHHEHEHEIDWDAEGDPPMVALVNQDGTEDFVGPYWVPVHGEGHTDHHVYVGAFDGAAHERIWRQGPFGRSTQARGSTRVVVAGTRVVVADYKATAHVYELATGKERATLKLPDRAREACAAPGGGPLVWLGVLSGQDVIVDTLAGTLRSAPRPAWCPERAGGAACAGQRGRTGCLPADQVPAIGGFRASRLVRDGGDGVGVGTQAAGTSAASPSRRLPALVGVDLKEGAGQVRWQLRLPAADAAVFSAPAPSLSEIADGIVYAQYELPQGGWRLTAASVRGGEQLWDVAVPGKKHGDEARSMTLSPSRLYLAHGDWLDIFDRKTGTLLGDFGK